MLIVHQTVYTQFRYFSFFTLNTVNDYLAGNGARKNRDFINIWLHSLHLRNDTVQHSYHKTLIGSHRLIITYRSVIVDNLDWPLNHASWLGTSKVHSPLTVVIHAMTWFTKKYKNIFKNKKNIWRWGYKVNVGPHFTRSWLTFGYFWCIMTFQTNRVLHSFSALVEFLV